MIFLTNPMQKMTVPPSSKPSTVPPSSKPSNNNNSQTQTKTQSLVVMMVVIAAIMMHNIYGNDMSFTIKISTINNIFLDCTLTIDALTNSLRTTSYIKPLSIHEYTKSSSNGLLKTM
eukprot:474694_1